MILEDFFDLWMFELTIQKTYLFDLVQPWKTVRLKKFKLKTGLGLAAIALKLEQPSLVCALPCTQMTIDCAWFYVILYWLCLIVFDLFDLVWFCLICLILFDCLIFWFVWFCMICCLILFDFVWFCMIMFDLWYFWFCMICVDFDFYDFVRFDLILFDFVGFCLISVWFV